MLIMHILLIKLNKNKLHKTNAILYAYLKLFQVFSTSNKSNEKSKQVPPKSFCHISAAAEKQL